MCHSLYASITKTWIRTIAYPSSLHRNFFHFKKDEKLNVGKEKNHGEDDSDDDNKNNKSFIKNKLKL